MILGTGVDLAEVGRIRDAIERYGDRFVQRIYTAAEIAYVERKANRFERYAGRFAAKEAGMKAIGTGWKRGVRWQDFEVSNLPSGRPTLRLHGVAAQLAEKMVDLGRRLLDYKGRVVRKESSDLEYLVDNPNRRCPVIIKARTELGFEPRVSIDEGLHRALVWYSGNSQATEA